MALPNHSLSITTRAENIPLVDVELLESEKMSGLHQFLVRHTDLSEEEYRALTLGDVNSLGQQVLEELKKIALPFGSKPT